MIILDTNVISELMKAARALRVAAWVAAQPSQSLFVTSVTQAEVLHGVAMLPSGRRRRLIEAAALAMFRDDFAGRVLPFASDAATLYARIQVDRRRVGRPISGFDAQIDAIAGSVGATLATRNTRYFEGCGIEVIDPWRADTP
jgi:predicted nucleic acid-binding protein